MKALYPCDSNMQTRSNERKKKSYPTFEGGKDRIGQFEKTWEEKKSRDGAFLYNLTYRGYTSGTVRKKKTERNVTTEEIF